MSKSAIYLCVTIYTFSSTPLFAYNLNLTEAIELGLSNSQSRHISREQLAIAEAQYQQAKSTYWPSINLNAVWERYDEDVTFTLENISVTASTPLGPLPANIPETDLKLFNRDIAIYSLDLSYPIYTGGKLSSIRKQAEIGIDIATKSVRRSDTRKSGQ